MVECTTLKSCGVGSIPTFGLQIFNWSLGPCWGVFPLEMHHFRGFLYLQQASECDALRCLSVYVCLCVCLHAWRWLYDSSHLVCHHIYFACVYFFNSSRLMRHDIEFVSLQVCIDFSSVFGPYIFFLPLHSSRLLYCGLAKLCQVYAYSMPLLSGFLAFLELVCSRRSSRYARFLSCT